MTQTKRFTFKPLLIIALLAAFGLVAVGCGDKDDSDGTASDANTPAQSESVDGDAASMVANTITDLLRATSTGDGERACALMTETYAKQNLIDHGEHDRTCEQSVADFAKADGELDLDSVNVTDIKFDGAGNKSATANVSYSVTTNGETEEYKNEPWNLIQVDRVWKVDGEPTPPK